ncbi:MAG: AMP-binding protein [Alteraurantiacibacter sp.]|nr:AMP-binding protein [Alteraurantiacibacter sp.]
MALTTQSVPQDQRDGLALVDERLSLTWAQLDPILNRAAHAMDAAVDDKRRVAVLAPNAAENVIAYVAGIEAGVSTVPVSYHLTVGELEYILADSGASVLLVGPETVDTGLTAARRVGVPLVVGWRCQPRDGLVAWNEWLAAAPDHAPDPGRRPLPHLHYTSGTTGRPKATRTPLQYWPDAQTIADFIAAIRPKATPSPGLVVGPLYHTGPLGQARNVAAGVALVVMGHFDAETVLALIERYKVAGSVMVPTHFQRLLALPDEIRTKYDVSSMKRLAHTGAACPLEVKRAMIDWFGPVLVEAYGGTEAGSTTFITSAEWLERPGSVGKALWPFTTLIIGPDGRELPPGKEGQIYFRDETGRGIVYEGDPEKTAAAHIAPGVFTLGEVGYVDKEGYLFITDRVSDMIVSGGVNIYPAEIEQVLLRHPEVADVAVIGVPNAEMGEEVKALIIPADAANPPSIDDLNAFCRASLAGFKCPRSYEFVDDIGRTAMGKVNKKALRQNYWPTERTIGG